MPLIYLHSTDNLVQLMLKYLLFLKSDSTANKIEAEAPEVIATWSTLYFYFISNRIMFNYRFTQL